MLRDQFVFGVQDSGPRGIMERLFREEDLTLQKAVDMARASEASREQMKHLREKEKEVNAVQKPGQGKGSKPYWCKKCSKKHLPRSCPAYGKACSSCGGANHFATCCRSKKDGPQQASWRKIGSQQASGKRYKKSKKKSVNAVQGSSEDESSGEEIFLGAVYQLNAVSKMEWTSRVTVNGVKLNMKLDTGAQANILAKSTYERIKPGKTLDRS